MWLKIIYYLLEKIYTASLRLYCRSKIHYYCVKAYCKKIIKNGLKISQKIKHYPIENNQTKK